MNSKLALLLPIRCLAFISIFLIMMVITNKDLSELTNTWSIVNILLIGLLFILAKIKKTTFFEIINYYQCILI